MLRVESTRSAQTPKARWIHELHDRTSPKYVSPEFWCITSDDLDTFHEEVRELWEGGGIPEDPAHENRHHSDPLVGPSVYQVNKHYIQPVTMDAGGMSWALMEHPDGQGPCDVYATHGWKEGVFEFISQVRRTWPRNRYNMYVCFLSNPQCGDIKVLFDVDLMDSPFAKALQSADHMIVVPNRTESIYLRLWCVFEAYEAIKATENSGMIIKMPWVMPPNEVAEQVVPAFAMPVLGWCLSRFVLGQYISNLFGPVMWLLSSFLLLWLMTTLAKYVASGYKIEVTAKHFVRMCYMELFILGITSHLALWHRYLWSWGGGLGEGNTHAANAAASLFNVQRCGFRFEPGEFFVIIPLMAALYYMYFVKVGKLLIRSVLDEEGSKLEFDTVRQAQYSDEADLRRIGGQIRDFDEMDKKIKDLIAVGRYDRSVIANLKLGMSPDRVRDGIFPSKVLICVMAWEFWWATDIAGRGYGLLAVILIVASCMAGLSFVYWRGDITIYALDIFMRCGLLFVVLSNSHVFFQAVAVEHYSMTRSTCALQLGCFLVALTFCIRFYSGFKTGVPACDNLRACDDIDRADDLFFDRADELGPADDSSSSDRE